MKRIVTLLLALSLFLSACQVRRKSVSKDFYHIAEISRVSVPNGGGLNYSFDSIELLETDLYGRELFLHTKWTEQVCILLICQNKDDTYAYYYEDFSYLIHPKDSSNFTQEEIHWLKEKNDWNKPLSQQHMASVNYKESERDIDNYNHYSKVIRSALNLEGDEVVLALDGLERDQNGNKYVLVKASRVGAANAPYTSFLVLYSDSGDGSVINYVEIEPALDCRKSIISFKEECTALTEELIVNRASTWNAS